MNKQIRKTYQFKLYQSKKLSTLHDQVNVSGIIWNHCVALHKRYYRLFGKSLNVYQLQKHITKLKKREKYAFWKLVPSQAIQDITSRVDKAYAKFFDDLKRKQRTSPPKFKAVRRYKSFTLKQAGWKLDSNILTIGKRSFKLFLSRELKGTVKTVTIKRNSLGEFFVYFSVIEDASQSIFTSGKSAGLDFGLKTFLTVSDGSEIHSPEFFKTNLGLIQQASRGLSSKKKGSNNRVKARLHLARVHDKTLNQRKDFFFKQAKELTQKFDYISIEDLNVSAMSKLWGRKISDLAFSEFVHILESQGQKYFCEITKVGRFYPSSKICFECGNVNKELRLEQRTWTCPGCNSLLHRDKNASLNLDREGGRVRALTHKVDKTAA
jgi:putative transposase